MKNVVWLLMEKERNENSTAIVFWYGILEQLGYNVIYYPYENYETNKFYNDMKSYKPDYIFHPCYHNLHLEFVRLREFSKVYVIQSDDDWRFDTYSKYYIPYVDGIISYQGERELYIKNGAKEEQIISSNWAFNPNTMLLESPIEKDLLINHCGGLHADREMLLKQFFNKGMYVLIKNNVSYEELLQTWSRSKYSLCFTKSSQGNFRQKKGRVSEIGYHSVLVSEPFPNIQDYYEPDKEFILFNSVDEAINKIKYYENHNDEYNKMLSASKKRILQTNTVFHQWNKIMKIIDQDYKYVNVDKILELYNL